MNFLSALKLSLGSVKTILRELWIVWLAHTDTAYQFQAYVWQKHKRENCWYVTCREVFPNVWQLFKIPQNLKKKVCPI